MSDLERKSGEKPTANDAANVSQDEQAPPRAGRPIGALPPRKDGVETSYQKSEQQGVHSVPLLHGLGNPSHNADDRAGQVANHGDGKAPIVLPKSRGAKSGSKVNLLASSELQERDRADTDQAGRKPVKLELYELGKAEKSPWNIHLPKFRELSDKTIGLAEALRIHRDLELSDWRRSVLPNWRWVAFTLFFVCSAIMTGYALTYGIPDWVKVHILRQELKSERLAFTTTPKLEAQLLDGGIQLQRVEMKVFIDEVEQLLKSREEAMKRFGEYASLEVSDEVFYFIRKQDGIETLVREHGAPNLVPKGWRPSDNSDWNVRTTATKPYALLSGTLPDGEPFFAYFIIENGQLVIDWKATTAYSSASLEQLATGEGDGSEVRGWLVPDTYFNGIYSEDNYHCYRFTPPGNQGVIWCYTLAGTPIANEMAKCFVGGGIVRNSISPKRVSLRIKKESAQALPNQWLIKELFGDDWLQLGGEESAIPMASELIGELELPRGEMKMFLSEVQELFKSRIEAIKYFGEYASLDISEDVLFFIRKQDGVEALARENGAPNLAPKGWRPSDNSDWNVRTTATKPYALLSGTLPDGEPFFAYFIIESGQLVMDWKATTAYSSASLEQLAAGEGDGSEVRGWVVPDTYFNGIYTEDKYHCYRVMPPGNQGVIWCYTLAGTPIANEMAQRFVGGGIVRNSISPSRAILRIKKGDEQALPNQWLIEELLGDDWLQL